MDMDMDQRAQYTHAQAAPMHSLAVNPLFYDDHGVLEAHHRDIYEEKARLYGTQLGYVNVSEIFSDHIKAAIAAEVNAAFSRTAVRRDLAMAQTDDSPRKMFNVRYTDLYRNCRTVSLLYSSQHIKNALSQIAGEMVFDCPWHQERYVATRLSAQGDTHGWHWDDYAFSLIFILEAPAAEDGGLLEMVCNSRWDKNKPEVERYVNSYPRISKHHSAGEVYLFRSDRTLHRVTPVRSRAQRTVLNMVFASALDYATESHKDHETMEKLFE